MTQVLTDSQRSTQTSRGDLNRNKTNSQLNPKEANSTVDKVPLHFKTRARDEGYST